MEAVSTENTKNEVKRRALPLLKESHSIFFVKTWLIFLVLDLQKVMFLCGSGQEEEYVHNNDESFKKEGFRMHNKDEKRMENKIEFFCVRFFKETHASYWKMTNMAWNIWEENDDA